MTDRLDRLETRIRDEAAAFVKRRQKDAPMSGRAVMARVAHGSQTGGNTMAGAGNAAVREKLETALRAERKRARSGSARYDFNRHIALHQALRSLDADANSNILHEK